MFLLLTVLTLSLTLVLYHADIPITAFVTVLLAFSLGAILVSSMKNLDLSWLGQKRRPMAASPDEAGQSVETRINPNCSSVNTFDDGQPGMPSGHTGTIAACATCTAIVLGYCLRNSRDFEHRIVVIVVAAILITVLMALARIAAQCHTWQQTLVGGGSGGIIGLILGIIYVLICKVQIHHPPAATSASHSVV
jgi:membrane-associated phospholipid phosphatase